MNVTKKTTKQRILIQGGAFRLDKGPTQAEKHAFRRAVSLYKEVLDSGKDVRLGCMVSDFASKPEDRPKATGRLELPEEYVRILQDHGIPIKDLEIFYETTLRNRASKDARKPNSDVVTKKNEHTGIPVPICASIMGRFYYTLHVEGYSQQIGFYTSEEKPKPATPDERPDNACPSGPVYGAMYDMSGYELRIEVLNFWVHSDGRVEEAGKFSPRK